MARPSRGGKWPSRLLRTVIASVPLAGEKLNLPAIVWPPLGSIEAYAARAATGIIAAFAALPSLIFRKKSSAKIGAAAGIIVASVSLCFYAHFLTEYVKRIDTPHNGVQYRSVGSTRTELANRNFPGASDEYILQQNGLEDADIKEMWTSASVDRARLDLFISYVLTLASFNFFLGALAKASPQTKKNEKGG